MPIGFGSFVVRAGGGGGDGGVVGVGLLLVVLASCRCCWRCSCRCCRAEEESWLCNAAMSLPGAVLKNIAVQDAHAYHYCGRFLRDGCFFSAAALLLWGSCSCYCHGRYLSPA